jgi:alkyl hydroperoxide reductase subunit F
MQAIGHQLLLLAGATTMPYKQIAMGEGAKAAPSAFDHLIRSTPVQDKETA